MNTIDETVLQALISTGNGRSDAVAKFLSYMDEHYSGDIYIEGALGWLRQEVEKY